jgi:hypothetical protein
MKLNLNKKDAVTHNRTNHSFGTFFGKKGAVEMSLNLIIMLIIGMVVLGLVIGFVNSLVNKGTEGFDKQIGDNEALKLEKVRSSSENLAVEPNPSISVKKGSKTNIFVKIRGYAEEIECNPGNLDTCSLFIYEVIDSEGNDATGDLVLSGPGFTASQGSEDAKMYTLSTGEASVIGTYYLTLKLYPEDDVNELAKTLTVTVN